MIKALSKKISLLTAGLVLLAHANVALAAFGISPPYINYEHIKAGTTYTETIILSTDKPDAARRLRTRVTGDEALIDWIRITKPERMPIGEKQVPIDVSISVPQGAQPGNYTGNIAIVVEPSESKQALDINLGGNVQIDVNVTDREYKDFIVRSATINPVYEGETLFVGMKISNKGNVPLQNADITLEIWNQRESDIIRTYETDELRYTVPAYKEQQTEVGIPLAELPAGKYWAKLRIAKDDGTVFETKSFLEVAPQVTPTSSIKTSLNVLREGEAFQASGLGSSSVKTSLRVKSPYETPLLIASALLVVLIVAGVSYRRFYSKR